MYVHINYTLGSCLRTASVRWLWHMEIYYGAHISRDSPFLTVLPEQKLLSSKFNLYTNALAHLPLPVFQGLYPILGDVIRIMELKTNLLYVYI